MIRNYLKIAFRNLLKHKGFTFINLTGLTIGLTATILIVLWIQDEMSYDRFFKNSDRLFRAVNYEKYTNGDETRFAMGPAALGPVLKSEYPEIMETARYRGLKSATVHYQANHYLEEHIVFADPSFFTIFSFHFIHGEPETALQHPQSIVLTEDMATKYFGQQNPIGKILNIDNTVDLHVSGVCKNIPANSHFNFDFLIPFEQAGKFGYPIEGWNSYAHTLYVLLDKNVNYQLLNTKISDVIKRNDAEAAVTVSLQPVTDIHLRSQGIWGSGGDGDIRYIYIFSFIAAFILLIACLNFMNLTTARSSARAKEIGLRKTIGARRNEIVFQFYGESLLITIFSLLMAIGLVFLLLPLYNELSGKHIAFQLFHNGSLITLMFGISLLTGLVSGSYPAIYLSSFKPAMVFKNKMGSGSKKSVLRKVLVTLQFILTIFLVTASIVVNRQLAMLQKQKLGYDKEQLVSIDLPGSLRDRSDSIINELKSNSLVENATAISNIPTRLTRSTVISSWEGNESDEQILFYLLSGDYNFAQTMGVEMTRGRYYSKHFKSDTAEGIIINETAALMLGYDDPVGKTVLDYDIIGVIKDFNFQSLHSEIGPLLIFFAPDWNNHILARISTENIPRVIHDMETSWKNIVPDAPFSYSFLDEQLNALYASEQQSGKIANIFTIIAIFIACLGLFGLAAYSAEQRTKEVGIRKVLGASMSGLFGLLSSEFLKWVIISNIFACPIAWYAMNKWLQNFAYRVPLQWWIFVAAGIITLLIAMLTVSLQVAKTTRTNPVEALRYE